MSRSRLGTLGINTAIAALQGTDVPIAVRDCHGIAGHCPDCSARKPSTSSKERTVVVVGPSRPHCSLAMTSDSPRTSLIAARTMPTEAETGMGSRSTRWPPDVVHLLREVQPYEFLESTRPESTHVLVCQSYRKPGHGQVHEWDSRRPGRAVDVSPPQDHVRDSTKRPGRNSPSPHRRCARAHVYAHDPRLPTPMLGRRHDLSKQQMGAPNRTRQGAATAILHLVVPPRCFLPAQGCQKCQSRQD